MMHALLKVPGWYQALTWLPTWNDFHLVKAYFWGNTLDIQMFDDTLSWVTLSPGSTSILGRWRHPYQVSCSLFRFHSVSQKATGSALLRWYILISHALSVLFIALGGPWSSFPLFRFGIGPWLHSRIFFPLVCLLNRWNICWWIVRCPRDNV